MKSAAPNWFVKRTLTSPMAAPFVWSLLVPSTRCAHTGAAYLVRSPLEGDQCEHLDIQD